MLEAGYVLHRRQYRETSLLLDMFTYRHGIVSLIAKGAYKGKSPSSAQLQAFRPLLVEWVGRNELKTLTKCESPSLPLSFPNNNRYVAMYLNELLHKLFVDNPPSPDLFECYVVSLDALTDASAQVASLLRKFEIKLLQTLGLMPDLSIDWLGEPVSANRAYYFSSESTLVPLTEDETGQSGMRALPTGTWYRGRLLISLSGLIQSQADMSVAEDVRANSVCEGGLPYESVGMRSGAESPNELESSSAKHLMRMLIDGALNGATLHSREMMKQIAKNAR